MVLNAKAVTYAAALPIVYDLIDTKQYFVIDESTGVVRLQNPINNLVNWKFLENIQNFLF